MFKTMPSVSFYDSKSKDWKMALKIEKKEKIWRKRKEHYMLGLKRIMAGKVDGFSLGNIHNGMILTEEVRIMGGFC